MSENWKTFELEIAKYFNTARRVRANNYAESNIEIKANSADWLQIPFGGILILVECKYRKSLTLPSKYYSIARKYRNKVLVLILEEYIIISKEGFKKFFETLVLGLTDLDTEYKIYNSTHKVPKYLNEYYEQAKEYINILDLKKIPLVLPLVALRQGGKHGSIFVFKKQDLLEIRENVKKASTNYF